MKTRKIKRINKRQKGGQLTTTAIYPRPAPRPSPRPAPRPAPRPSPRPAPSEITACSANKVLVRNTGYKIQNKDVYRLSINNNLGRYFILNNNNNAISVNQPKDSSGKLISMYAGKQECINRPTNLSTIQKGGDMESVPPMPKFLSDIWKRKTAGGKRKKTRKNKKSKSTRKTYRSLK